MQIQRLDDGDFLIHIDCDLRSVAERKMFIAKDEDGNLVNPENVPIIVRLARARKMIEMLSSGTYRNKQEIGDMFGMSQAQVSQLCRSAFLSPVIVKRLRIRNSRRPTSSTAHCRFRASRLSPTSSSRFHSGPSNTRFWGSIDKPERETAMNELDFLNNEARIASAFAPEGAQVAVVASLRPNR